MHTMRVPVVVLALAALLSLSSPAFGRTAASQPAPGTPTQTLSQTQQQAIQSLIPPPNPGPYDQIYGVISEFSVLGVGGFLCDGSSSSDDTLDSMYVKLANGKNALIYVPDSGRKAAVAAALAVAYAHGMPVTLRGLPAACENTIKAFEVYLQK